MYSIDELKELISAIDHSSVTNFTIKGIDGEKITIKKDITVSAVNTVVTPPVQNVTVSSEDTVVENTEDNFKIIKSPMVGVFYSASAPDAEPYVSVGSKVSVGDTVCIVEAMKLMNEVVSEINGEIVEVCVSNGDVVEYGQTLFKLK